MTTGKHIALTRWTFVDKVMSLLLNMLSRLVITFLPRSKFLTGTQIETWTYPRCCSFDQCKKKKKDKKIERMNKVPKCTKVPYDIG